MMKIVWILLSLLLTLYAQNSSRNDPYKNIEYFKLGNGMQVYLLADPKAEKTSVRLTVGVGYDNETADNYGISHLVEHLVFRDRRVPHHDYLDWFKDEGATNVNGYTGRYETTYLATVPAKKSEWAVQTFAQMLFDKNVTREDLEVERKALQTEIGEPRWYERPLTVLGEFFQKILPPREDFYAEEFGLPRDKPLPPLYLARENNRRFTLADVTARYEAYYYPANMKLAVAGRFDAKKMRETIKKHFGKVRRNGTQKVAEPYYTPKPNRKPYRRFYEGMYRNYAIIGAKYRLQSYKQFLILDAYSEALAQRLQQQLRNRDGKTYTVSEQGFSDKIAGAALIGFDGLHDVFSQNIAAAQKSIEADRKGMDPAAIRKALDWYEKRYYADMEHDTGTLTGLVETADYLRTDRNITDRTAYDIFKSITPEDFQKTVTETFRPENRYKFVAREYYFFPMDVVVISLVTLIIFIVIYIFFAKWQLRRRGVLYTYRDILFHRRLSSRMTGFLIFVLTGIIASVTYEWIKYLFFKWVMGDPRWLMTVDVPWSYLVTVLDALGYIIWFFLLYYHLWRYYATIFALRDKLIVVGNRIAVIEKDNIAEVGVVPRRARRKGAVTYGTAWRFRKPLTELKCKDGKICYLRAANAEHLKEDLQKWLASQ